MVLVQILVGGITRLTGSGLSITRWEIVTGTLPPLNSEQWLEAFNLYAQTPQYQLINKGISLSEYKYIIFWEYIHRLWARTMGLVFLLPFLIFLFLKAFDSWLIKRLGVIIILACLAAVFGWIMVASGLINRPWVNAYKLTVHLGLGMTLFIYLFFTWLSYRGYTKYSIQGFQRIVRTIIFLAIVQIAFGGFVSGMKSALSYPTWPLMNSEWVPDVVIHADNWNTKNFLMYDKSGFMPALVQVVHRNLAYILALFVFIFAVRWYRQSSPMWRWISFLSVAIIVVQVTLGVLTLLNSKGSIPIGFGAFHQVIGIILLTYFFYIDSLIRVTPDNQISIPN
ncbi:MAG: COX15/CtaA family protein [Bacteroidota bacterium]|nr:COX15/CtaA family protein [Bacteroidota bacterium]